MVIERGVIITGSIFSKFLRIDTPSLAREDQVSVSSVSFNNSHSYPTLATAMLCATSYHTVPCYSGIIKDNNIAMIMHLNHIFLGTSGLFNYNGLILITTITPIIMCRVKLLIPKLQRCSRRSLEMAKIFHPTLHGAYAHLSTLGF